MEFKKVYIEITNNCNLNCKFCIGNKREKMFMELKDFKIILNKLQGFTRYLYFHIMGEPLLHPRIEEFIREASENYFVNITTNGYLIKKIKDCKNIRQVNISLHSFNENANKSLDDYLKDILEVSNKLAKEGTFISLRMWSRNVNKDTIIGKINDYFGTRITGEMSCKIKDNIFYETMQEFVWPSLTNDFYSEKGTCYGTRHHIGILVNGDIVPCCLDSNGDVKLGNIYKEELNDIICSEKFLKMKNGFISNQKVEELCKHCDFKKNMF